MKEEETLKKKKEWKNLILMISLFLQWFWDL